MSNKPKITKISRLLIIALFLSSNFVFGQKPVPPIPAEIFFGNDAIFSQLVINRDFAPNSKFSLFSLATYTASYDQEKGDNELATINQVNYSVGRGFSAMVGVNVNSEVGLTPVIGPKHVFVSKTFLSVSILSFSVDGDNDLGFFGLYEYTPPINENLALLARFQVLYNQGLGEMQHNRSFLYLRAGLKKNRLSFGLASNLDQYGPKKKFKENYGLFAEWNF